MTNFEHMTEEEKKLAIIRGLYRKSNGEVVVCGNTTCGNCAYFDECEDCLGPYEKEAWLNAEYVAPKTANEKFCETLKVGEVIAVSDTDETVMNNYQYSQFIRYDVGIDRIKTKKSSCWGWQYGRKLTAEERGE